MNAVTHDSVWATLTPASRERFLGNLDPWAGPVDPDAYARAQARQPRTGDWREQREQGTCGCWHSDCAECGARRADGQRPPKGHRRARALRVDAALQQARALAERSVLP